MDRPLINSNAIPRTELRKIVPSFPNSRRVTAIGLALIIASSAIGQSPLGKDLPTLARETSPSVVTIVLRDQTGVELGSGSGFVVGSDGRVVTNFHVVHMSGTTQADARFADGASYHVQGVIASDSDRDLAVLQLQATGKVFQALRLGDSEQVQTGERVLAIGSPLAGLSPLSTEATVSDGIISGIRDWPENRMKVFQITAPISPGSSGGVLVNLNGDVIGVTFAQLVGGQNLNFAVPIAYVRPLLTEGSTKSLAAFNAPATPAPDDHSKIAETAPTGSYTGVWRSGKFAVSGAAQMTIKIAEGEADAEIFLTGGEVTSANLNGTAHKTGENIWTLYLSSKKPRLSVRGIFRGNSFVGDYTYSRFLVLDHGQWILKKE
jgi:S1-C subfamily serine protease